MSPASNDPELVEGSKVSLSPQCWERGSFLPSLLTGRGRGGVSLLAGKGQA
jgi:hypothetical protein